MNPDLLSGRTTSRLRGSFHAHLDADHGLRPRRWAGPAAVGEHRANPHRKVNRMTIRPNDLALLILRAILGTVFVAHGAQKLFGWFGGDGLLAEANSMAERGLRPAELMAVLAGLSEFGAGLLILLGLLTPLGALALAIVMVTATATDTGQNGFFIQNDGFEYNLVLFTICAAFLFAGAGAYSLDRALSARAPRLRTLLRQAPEAEPSR